MSGVCPYHFEQIVGHCLKCKSWVCTACLPDHLEHLANIVVMNKLTESIARMQNEFQLLENQKQQLVGQARQAIEVVRIQCKEYLDRLEAQLNWHLQEVEKAGAIKQYLQGLTNLKSCEYQLIRPEQFENLYKLLEGGEKGPGQAVLKRYDTEILALKKAVDECSLGFNGLRASMTNSTVTSIQMEECSQKLGEADHMYMQKNYEGAAKLLTEQLNGLINKFVMHHYGRYIDKHLDALRKCKDREGVARLTQLLVALQPDHPVNHYNLGVAQANCGRLHLAMEVLKQGKRKGFSRTEIYLVCGDIYEKLEQPTKAIEEYDQAIRIDPNNLTVRERRTRLIAQTTLPKAVIPTR